MPYAEAQRYSDVYGSQKDFSDQLDKILEDEAQFLGVVAKTNFGHNKITAGVRRVLRLSGLAYGGPTWLTSI